ncbi:hypothetical protein [uncultured Nostoc sp.]|uniref:hypothetical protein n=1 Tax=uncultured Nostoc sp. TaxID=340711 RepID=UPI0035CA8272
MSPQERMQFGHSLQQQTPSSNLNFPDLNQDGIDIAFKTQIILLKRQVGFTSNNQIYSVKLSVVLRGALQVVNMVTL